MLWSFIAVCFSAWLYVDASYRGPTWQRWLFKPVTLLLLLLLAWQAPMFNAVSYLVLAGLCASLIGDALTLLPRQRLLYAVGAFFLSHLLYTIYFASQMTLSFFWPLPLVLLVIGALLIAVIWSRLEEMRLPICTLVRLLNLPALNPAVPPYRWSLCSEKRELRFKFHGSSDSRVIMLITPPIALEP